MNDANTKQYKKCRRCKRMFIVGDRYEPVTNYCSRCDNVGFFEEMRKKGCSVIDPNKLGDTPLVSPRQKEDYPRITADGTEYIDITDYFFYDTQFKKEYLSNEEMERREQERLQQIIGGMDFRAEGEKNRRKELTERQKKLIIKAYNEMYSYQDISKRTNVGMNRVSRFLKQMKDEGVVADRPRQVRHNGERAKLSKNNRKIYTREEEKEIMKLYKEGKDLREIAKIMGRTYSGIKGKVERLLYIGYMEVRG